MYYCIFVFYIALLFVNVIFFLHYSTYYCFFNIVVYLFFTIFLTYLFENLKTIE